MQGSVRLVLAISNSELRTYKRCKRSWALHYLYQWSEQPGSAPVVGNAELGTRIHTALEAYYGYGIDPLQALEVIYAQLIAVNPYYQNLLEKEKGYAVAMVEGYLDWSAEEGIDADLEVLATERVVSVEIETELGTVNLQGKLDQLVRRRSDGAILFRDWKTVGTLSKSNMLILDEQMRFYTMLLVLANGPETRVDGGLYTMLLRSKRTARATGPFFKQDEVVYNRQDVESMRLRTVEAVTDLLRTRQRLLANEDHRAVAYPSPGDHCRWACPFTMICPLMDDGSRWEDALRGNFTQADPYHYYGSDLIDLVRTAFGQTP